MIQKLCFKDIYKDKRQNYYTVAMYVPVSIQLTFNLDDY